MDKVFSLFICLLCFVLYGFDLADCIEHWKNWGIGNKALHLVWVAVIGFLAMMWSVITYNVWFS